MVKSRSRKVHSSSKSSQSSTQPVAQPVAQLLSKSIDQTTINSKKTVRSFKVKLPETETYVGRFTGLTPYQAANKALTKYYKEKKNSITSTQIKFTIKESTRGSKKKEYTYNGIRTKLTTPVSYPITDNKGVIKTIIKQFKNTLSKVKLADLPKANIPGPSKKTLKNNDSKSKTSSIVLNKRNKKVLKKVSKKKTKTKKPRSIKQNII